MKPEVYILAAVVALASATAQAPAVRRIMEEIEPIALDACNRTYQFSDPPEVVERSRTAKRRIIELGEDADFALAEIVLQGLSEWEHATLPLKSPARAGVQALMRALRNDPKLVPRLLPAYIAWIDRLATGQMEARQISATEEAAIYINQWGTEAQRRKLKEQASSLKSSSEYSPALFGGAIESVLDGKSPALQFRAPTVPFHRWCIEREKAVEREIAVFFATEDRRETAIADPKDAKRVWSPEQPGTRSGTSDSAPPAPISNAIGAAQPDAFSGQPYLWASIAAIVAGAVGWLFVRSKRRA